MTPERSSPHHRRRAVLHGRRFASFSLVGLVNTATDLAVFAALMAAGLAPVFANGAGFAAANAQSYWLNAQVTFRENGAPARLSAPGYLKFAAAHLFSLAISTAAILVFSGAIGPVAAKLAALVFTAASNYALASFFVFRPQGDVS